MTDDLVVEIDDLVGHPEATRNVSGVHQVDLRLGEVTVKGPMTVTGVVTGTVDGVIARYEARSPAHFSCVRCLTEWEGEVATEGIQHFSKTPDEDGYAIEDHTVDLSGPATDELALSLPAAPLCRPECGGLCPICGTDLNSDPCDGHGEESDSPFAALKDLFDS
ncbi:MAG: YceD family protein [Acidimicrobiia bacterium]